MGLDCDLFIKVNPKEVYTNVMDCDRWYHFSDNLISGKEYTYDQILSALKDLESKMIIENNQHSLFWVQKVICSVEKMSTSTIFMINHEHDLDYINIKSVPIIREELT